VQDQRDVDRHPAAVTVGWGTKMDVELTSEQTMLQKSTRDFLEARAPVHRVRELISDPVGYDPEIWETGASLGWSAMLVPEAHGGSGLGREGVIEAAILAEELGRVLYSGPFLPVNVVADAVSQVGSLAQKEAILPGLVRGTCVATWAIADGPGCWDGRGMDITAIRHADGYVLNGVKRWVQDAAGAELLLVTCRAAEGHVQLLVRSDAPGLALVPLAAADMTRRFADVEFSDTYVSGDWVLGDASGVNTQVARQLHVAVVLQCCEGVGATDRILKKTVDYAKDRMAFGRPIGSFQAIKQLLADAATWLEAAQAATWSAVRALAGDRSDLARAVHIAKMFTARRCPRIVEDCMQVHGGIAMTWDDDCHLFLRRVRSNSMLFGTAGWHSDRLCEVIGMKA
jgi:alkylation response protein AidB-like acyl-CoA dehydrogenase